jgi:hypothetical protein
MMLLTPDPNDSLADDIAKLGPLWGHAFMAAVIVVMLALFAIAIWGMIKGYRGVKVVEPQPG